VKLLNRIVDKLQATFPPNRIVVTLTPIVFVPAAASASGWVAEHFPGVDVPAGGVLGLMGAGALAALTLAYKWVDGWQKGEHLNVENDLEDALAEFLADPDAAKALANLHPELLAELVDLSPLADVGRALATTAERVGAGELSNPDAASAITGLEETLRAFVAQHSQPVVAPASSA